MAVYTVQFTPSPGTAYPVCTGGERACPPEDCGGIGGFYDLLDALGDPTHDQHEELQELGVFVVDAQGIPGGL